MLAGLIAYPSRQFFFFFFASTKYLWYFQRYKLFSFRLSGCAKALSHTFHHNTGWSRETHGIHLLVGLEVGE